MVGALLFALGIFGPQAQIHRDYVCERNHASVDFNRSRVRRVDMTLALDWSEAAGTRWRVTGPANVSGDAQTFPANTGSIGGSEGIRWRSSDGTSFTALISISDIITDLGAGSLWLDVTRSDRPEREQLTCGPVPSQNQQESQS